MHHIALAAKELKAARQEIDNWRPLVYHRKRFWIGLLLVMILGGLSGALPILLSYHSIEAANSIEAKLALAYPLLLLGIGIGMILSLLATILLLKFWPTVE